MTQGSNVSSESGSYHHQPAEEVLQDFQVDPERGLDAHSAATRLKQYGPNELESEPPTPAWKKFLAQFRDVMVLLLIAAAVISLGLWAIEGRHSVPYEALVILAIIFLNAVLGFVQEARAEKAVAALRAMSAAEARVLRDGVIQRIAARDLVPGDILVLEEGDAIAADARLFHVAELHTLEAPLTGESTPVAKDITPARLGAPVADRHNMVYSGTIASGGRGRAVVTATGMATEIGRIAGLLRQPRAEITPLQKELNHTGRWIAITVGLIAAVVVVTLVAVAEKRDFSTFLAALLFGVALAVAAVPEGLAAVITAVLALGVQRMAKRGAIVRKLPAVETLGAATVIASDKTGTLTRNEMTVRALVTASGHIEVSGAGYAPEGSLKSVEGPLTESLAQEARQLLEAAVLANNASLERRDGVWSILGDPTEGALIVAARKHGVQERDLALQWPRVGELPFSSARKRMSTLHRHGGSTVLYCKGAADVLLTLCTRELCAGDSVPLTDARREAIRTSSELLAEGALRMIGVAFRLVSQQDTDKPLAELENGLTFLGLIGMIDPPREEAAAAVAKARAAGIRPIMITGDHPATARAIASQVNFAEGLRVITGAELEGMDQEALDSAVRECQIYARVNPEHKLRLVQALKRQGEVVAMTGDGVNDAPALHAADIGVAMGITGTDVAKEASDMIITDDNFATIVAAIEEGRTIYSNIQKFLRYLLSSNTGEVLTIFLGVVLGKWLGLQSPDGSAFLAVSAAQILWINLITDGPPALALGVDPAAPDIMLRSPRPRGAGVVTRAMMVRIVLVGLVMAIGTLGVLDASLPGGLISGAGNVDYGQTMAFQTLVLFQIFNLFHSRSETRSAFSRTGFNPWVWGSVVISVGSQVCVLYVPLLRAMFNVVALTGTDWLICTGVASSVLWTGEAIKWLNRREISRNTASA